MIAKMNRWFCWIDETRPDVLHAKYEKLLKESGFHIVGECCKMFSPHGYTVLFLLSESHLAIHTFPEEGRTYVELSSCVDGPYQLFVEAHGGGVGGDTYGR